MAMTQILRNAALIRSKFRNYGFPESQPPVSHCGLCLFLAKEALSRCICGAILNSQPMGFYAPAQLVRDASAHGVEIRPADVNFSEWDNTLENNGDGYRALRLGFRQIKGLQKNEAMALIAARDKPYSDPSDIQRRTQLTDALLERLARADAYASMGLRRRDALWAVQALPPAPLPLFKAGEHRKELNVSLPAMAIGEEVTRYATTRLSLKPTHRLTAQRVCCRAHCPTSDLRIKDGIRVTIAESR